MRYYPNSASLEDIGRAAIEAARELRSVFDGATLDLEDDAELVHTMFEALESGHLYRETVEPGLDALARRVLDVLSDRVPGYRIIATAGDTTDDYYFLDEELEGIRRTWEQLRVFRRLRQTVIDAVEAERQLAALRRLSTAFAEG